MKALLGNLEERLEELEKPGDSEPEVTPEPQERHSEAAVNQERGHYLPSRGLLWGTHFNEFKESRVAVHGFVDLEYVDAENGGASGGVSGFDNHHVNVFLRTQLNRSLLAHVELEYEHSGEEVEIDQAYVDWRLNESTSLRLGRFYTPFGIERFVWYSPTNMMISRPLVMRQIIPGNFYANGLMTESHFGGDSRRFTFEVGVTDGLGDDALDDRRGSRQARDNNSSRALSGRAAFALWPWIEVGASLHKQRYASDADLDLEFVGIDLSARWKGMVLRSEFVDARIDRELGRALEQKGWYAELGYILEWDRTLLPSLALLTRRDVLDLDKSRSGHDDRRSWSLGVNLEIYANLRFKLEHQWNDEGAAEIDDDAFLSQIVFDF